MCNHLWSANFAGKYFQTLTCYKQCIDVSSHFSAFVDAFKMAVLCEFTSRWYWHLDRRFGAQYGMSHSCMPTLISVRLSTCLKCKKSIKCFFWIGNTAYIIPLPTQAIQFHSGIQFARACSVLDWMMGLNGHHNVCGRWYNIKSQSFDIKFSGRNFWSTVPWSTVRADFLMVWKVSAIILWFNDWIFSPSTYCCKFKYNKSFKCWTGW